MPVSGCQQLAVGRVSKAVGVAIPDSHDHLPSHELGPAFGRLMLHIPELYGRAAGASLAVTPVCQRLAIRGEGDRMDAASSWLCWYGSFQCQGLGVEHPHF